ncbi:hypothetical protein NQZ68_004602 [Dissostichus eleginoides]|nr:hypothetical protein NQZ68_004602 [Dissostichus eleginoides]
MSAIVRLYETGDKLEKKLVSADKIRDGSFVKGGFNNWRKAGEKSWEHEKSHQHTGRQQTGSIKTNTDECAALTSGC